MILTALDPSLVYSRTKSSPEKGRVSRDRSRHRRKSIPSRSVSPSNQAAGLLFRLSQGSVESICIGTIDHPAGMSLAGQPLPPLSRDYGFSLAARERIKNPSGSAETPTHSPSPSLPDSPDAFDDDDDYRVAPPAKAKSRRLGHPPTPRNCISCGATKTPYWREAWSSSVLLCNACGLRFSKFRRRCLDCSYVPRKEDKGSKACTKCGGPWS